jgi:dolichyl-phosphate beta-glucosyltransferase
VTDPTPPPSAPVEGGADFDLSIVIPAFNEAARLPATLRALHAFLAGRPWRVEIIVVDDGSSDDTAGIASTTVSRSCHQRVVSLGTNQGKGAAVKRGVAEGRGATIAFVDADLPYAFDAFDRAMGELRSGADVVIGGRDLPGSSDVMAYGWTRWLSGRVYSLLVNALAVRGIPDTQCGFKWFQAASAKQLFPRVTLTGFAFDVELLVIAQCWGLRIERIPVTLTHSHDSKVRLVRDSIRMFWDLLKVNRRRARAAYRRGTGAGSEPGAMRRMSA